MLFDMQISIFILSRPAKPARLMWLARIFSIEMKSTTSDYVLRHILGISNSALLVFC